MATNVSVNVSSNSNNCAEKSVLAELVCEGQGLYSAYEQGISDGRDAAADGDSDACPQSDDLSGYCIGLGTGYKEVSGAQETLNKVNCNNNKNNDDNDNDNDETPKRVIQNIPKRIIGDNN